eukprot:c20796_g1_i2.p1 GENE.c20796_g1_i2~~c20796_g1_i2.p1  ORF type:complete len:535 (-),score=90.29 c20796_g1_i2:29-1591(-)
MVLAWVLLVLLPTHSDSCDFINLSPQNIFSSSGSSPGAAVENLVDLSSNVWDSDSGFSGEKFVVFDFVVQRKVDCLKLKPNALGSSPSNFTIFVSSDGVNFNNIETFTNAASFTSLTPYSIDTASFGRYWGLVFHSTFSSAPVQLEFVQFSVDQEFRVVDSESKLHAYTLQKTSLPWINARTQCKSINSNLAKIYDSGTQSAMSSVLTQGSVLSVWIGLNDRNKEGEFVWQGSLTVESNFPGFAANPPDNSGGAEDCVVLVLVSGAALVNDVSCSSSAAFLCEKSDVITNPCDSGFTFVGGKCYKMFSTTTTSHLARVSQCAAVQASVPCLDDDTHRLLANELIGTTNMFLGVTDLGRTGQQSFRQPGCAQELFSRFSQAVSVSDPADAQRSFSGVLVGTEAQSSKLSSSSGWTAPSSAVGHFVLLDLLENSHVAGVATKGNGQTGGFVQSIQIETSKDGVLFDTVGTFQANTDQDTLVRISFPQAAFARYVRVVPVTFQGSISMRLGVLINSYSRALKA